MAARRDDLLAKAGLQVSPAEKPSISPDHVKTPLSRCLPVDHVEARDLLATQRLAHTTLPSTTRKSLRRFVPGKRLLRQRESDQSSWVFNNHEVAQLLDSLLEEATLRSVGVAQAVLLHAGDLNLEQLWHSRQHDASQQARSVDWLNTVTSRGSLDYVRLLCEMRPTDGSLSAAFRLALDNGFMGAVEVLLSYGANASSCGAAVHKQMRSGKVDLIKLLLANPRATTDAFWCECLRPCANVAPAVLSLCLSHRPTLSKKDMLREALAAQKFETTAVLLAHTTAADLALYDGSSACSTVSNIDLPAKRYAFFDLFYNAGLLSDNVVLRAEMMEDLKNGEISLVCLLVKAGIVPDVGPENPLKWAVTKMDFQLIDILCTGNLENAIAVLDWIPEDANEKNVIRLLGALPIHGLTGDALHRRLIVASRLRHKTECMQLIGLGASVNYGNAKALHAVIRKRHFSVLDILLQGPCSLETISSLIPAILEWQDRQKRLAFLEKVLCRTVLPGSLNRPLEILVAHPGEADFACIELLLRHGASSDASEQDSTNSVLVATRRWNFRLLEALCKATVRPQILARAVFIAFQGFPSGKQDQAATLATMRYLLSKGATGTPIYQVLLSAVTHDACANITGLLLSFGADANQGQGEAFAKAVSGKSFDNFKILYERCPPDVASTERLLPITAAAGHMEALQLILRRHPPVEVVKSACLTSQESFAGRNDISQTHKSAIYEVLLKAITKARGRHLSDLLYASVQRSSADTHFPALLLTQGAQIQDRTIQAGLDKASDDLLALLTRRTKRSSLFELVSEGKMSERRRLSLLSDMLKQEVNQVAKSQALLHSLTTDRIHDLTVAKLLLKHGADVSFRNGESIALAIKAKSSTAVGLLSKYIKTEELANFAFLCVLEATAENARTRFEMYRSLLISNLVDLRHRDKALYVCLDHQGADIDTVRLLLERGAVPDPQCLAIACGLHTMDQFRELSRHSSLDLVAQTLIFHINKEGDAARWFKLCLKDQPPSTKITSTHLLFECIRKFPDGRKLMSLILKQMVSVSPTVPYRILPSWTEERCSILIWALLAAPKVSNKTILELLAADFIDIDYETDKTQVCAVLACLLDGSRTSVLKELLQKRPQLAVDYQVSVTALAHLGAHPQAAHPDQIRELGTPTLRMASLYLGNIEAFKLLDDGIILDESLLHLAAFLALPKFAKHLLGAYRTDSELEEYGNYTPLAVAIESTTGSPWCKVANAEAPFDQRRKDTIRLLAPRSNLSWRFRQKTYVHLAFEAGLETTETLLDALAIKDDPHRFEKLVYEDKARRRYTPCEYVIDLMRISSSDQRDLVQCLARANLLTEE